MTIVIFGATGRTGRRLIQQALAQGHRVRAYVRDRRKFEVQQVEIFEGEIDDVASMERAVEGTDAVFSTLGPTKTSPPDLMTRAAANIVKAMKKKGIRRLIWQTGAGVRDEQDPFSLVRMIMVFLMKVFSPSVHSDSEAAFQTIKNSELDWTVIRVPVLKDGDRQGGYKVGFSPPGPVPLSRADIAEFMLRQLTDRQYMRQSPFIGR